MGFSRSVGLSGGAGIAAVVFAVIGCGNDVTPSSGGAGATSTSVANVSATQSTNTAASATIAASSSTGTGDKCDQACAKAATCGFDVCSTIPLNCDNPTFACAADCINDNDCAAIGRGLQGPVGTCVTGCLGQGQGGAGGGGTGQACFGCMQTNACIPASCASDPDCQAWGLCAVQCAQGADPDCYTACDTAHPEAASIYQGVYGCACTHCNTDCAAPVAPCNHLPPGTGGAGGGI